MKVHAFVRQILILAVVLWAGQAAAGLCRLDQSNDRVHVEYVYDGDTLRLTDGRKLRLIGINTPERGYDGEPSEPLAERAREALESLIGSQRTLLLRYDSETTDKYGRRLAHAYLPDGTNVAAQLLRAGLGFQLTVPPNVWNVQCYISAERIARKSGSALWSQPPHAAAAAEALPEDGFHRVSGRVSHVRRTSRNVWVNFDGGFSVRIARTDLEWFRGFPMDDLTGKRVTVRGWVYRSRGQPVMRVRHPAAFDEGL